MFFDECCSMSSSAMYVCPVSKDEHSNVLPSSVYRNERPFVCEICHHAFTQKVNLNMHLRTHTGEKPYQCHLCGKTFRTQGKSTSYLQTVCAQQMFICCMSGQHNALEGTCYPSSSTYMSLQMLVIG